MTDAPKIKLVDPSKSLDRKRKQAATAGLDKLLVRGEELFSSIAAMLNTYYADRSKDTFEQICVALALKEVWDREVAHRVLKQSSAREHLAAFAAALKRPKDYFEMSAKERWQVDEELGILDWSGPKNSEEQKVICDHHGISRREGDKDCDDCTGCE